MASSLMPAATGRCLRAAAAARGGGGAGKKLANITTTTTSSVRATIWTLSGSGSSRPLLCNTTTMTATTTAGNASFSTATACSSLLTSRSPSSYNSLPSTSFTTAQTRTPSSICSRINRAYTTQTTPSYLPPSSSSPSPSTKIPPPSTSSDVLTWDRYLQLRTIRRRYNLVFSALAAMGTTVAGAAALSQQDPESMGAMSFGLDPVVVLGAATLACGAVGWLLGPFAGGAVFGLVHRRFAKAMEGKEREFYQRIKRYRSDPAGQSMNNPVPDYYGEKITSVRDYRRWLKDQRAFRKKREG